MSIRGLSNAKVTAWDRRTGSDNRGRGLFLAQVLLAPMLAVVAEPTASQRRTAELEGKAVSSVIMLEADHAKVVKGRGRTLIGAHGVASAPRANAAKLEIVRFIVNSDQVADAETGIVDERIGEFNDAGNGPIDIVVCIRFVDAADDTYDNPPEITAPEYLDFLDSMVAALSAVNAQIAINRKGTKVRDKDRLGVSVQIGQEIRNGPGRYEVDENHPDYVDAASAAVETQARHARYLALYAHTRAHILANVPNAEKINWVGPAMTQADIANPAFVPEEGNDNQARWQSNYQDWIDLGFSLGFINSIHLNVGTLNDARPRIDGPKAYSDSKGYTTYYWAATEISPARYVPHEDIDGAAAFDKALYTLALANDPVFLCRAAFFETPGSGDDFVFCSILQSDALTPKEPFASILAAVLLMPASASGVIAISEGDRIKVEYPDLTGKTLLVTRKATPQKNGLGMVSLFVIQEAA